jgi:hypothetical protein
MMAGTTAESPITVLPKELMIDILSRDDLNNTIQLRCVCKLWKSLVVDPEFMMNHLYRSLTEILVLYAKATEIFKAFTWQGIINNPVVAQEQEQDDEDDAEDGKETPEEDKEEEEEEEEKRLTMNESVQMDNLNQVDERKQLVLNELAKLENRLATVRSINEEVETMNINIDMQPSIDLEDRMKYLRSFMQIYLKSLAT